VGPQVLQDPSQQCGGFFVLWDTPIQFMRTQLLLEMYDKESEDFVAEIDISKYDLKTINRICPSEDEFDYEYTDGYEIMEDEFIKLSEYIVELKELDYNKYSYGIITRSI